MWYSRSPLGKCPQPEPPHCPFISNGSSLSFARVIAHRLKFCSFSIQFTSFAGHALTVTWRPSWCIAVGMRGAACVGRLELVGRPLPIFLEGQWRATRLNGSRWAGPSLLWRGSHGAHHYRLTSYPHRTAAAGLHWAGDRALPDASLDHQSLIED